MDVVYRRYKLQFLFHITLSFSFSSLFRQCGVWIGCCLKRSVSFYFFFIVIIIINSSQLGSIFMSLANRSFCQWFSHCLRFIFMTFLSFTCGGLGISTIVSPTIFCVWRHLYTVDNFPSFWFKIMVWSANEHWCDDSINANMLTTVEGF